jgi:hypothetical protein
MESDLSASARRDIIIDMQAAQRLTCNKEAEHDGD